MEILKDYSLKILNTFGIEAKTKYFTEVNNLTGLLQALEQLDKLHVPHLMLGGGSNILFTKDFDGLTIKNSLMGIKVIEETPDNILIEAGGGENWSGFVQYCIDRNYGGIENLILIPGCVGAAPIQNIGAYGVEIKETFHSLQAIELATGITREFKALECNFGYRDSIFKRELKNRYVIIKVRFLLAKNPAVNLNYEAVRKGVEEAGVTNPTIKDIGRIISEIRMAKLPNPAVVGNAGSFFKNPEIKLEKYQEIKEKYPDIKSFPTESGNIKIPAAWLIEKSGWKGKRVGNTGSYEKQALALVNYGGATGKEVYELSQKIMDSVSGMFGIELEREVNII
ncbi:MAG TPA: UDP-N-acetylmuramate dehydrogenase [Ignavibacteriales bacterium]|nr:UDP-N-acetylmuramate dehydrogenase [Ignavibacteriales bacterium]